MCVGTRALTVELAPALRSLGRCARSPTENNRKMVVERALEEAQRKPTWNQEATKGSPRAQIRQTRPDARYGAQSSKFVQNGTKIDPVTCIVTRVFFESFRFSLEECCVTSFSISILLRELPTQTFCRFGLHPGAFVPPLGRFRWHFW